MRKNSKLDGLLYLIIGIIFFIDYAVTISQREGNGWVYATFFVVGAASYGMFIADREFLSVHKMLSVYLIVFAYLAPLKQYISSYRSWPWMSFTDQNYIDANLLVILFIVSYCFAKYLFFKKVRLKIFKLTQAKHEDIYVKNSILMLLTAASIACFVYLIATGRLINPDKVKYHLNSTQSFLDKVIRFFPVACILYTILENKKGRIRSTEKSIRFFWWINGLMAIIIFFPLNATVSRFFMFGVYIIVCSAIFENYKHNSFVLIAAAVGFYYIFPAFNFFKRHGISDIAEFALGGFNFNFVDYDAHHMFMSTIKYVETSGMTYGTNLLTALFCMIPRSIWSGKMDPSGKLISRSNGAQWTNLSCPAYAEGYFAFGIVGVILIAFIIGLIIKRLEDNKDHDSLLKGVNCIVIGMAIYWMRGAMLPATAYTLGLLVSYIIVYVIGYIDKVFTVRLDV